MDPEMEEELKNWWINEVKTK